MLEEGGMGGGNVRGGGFKQRGFLGGAQKGTLNPFNQVNQVSNRKRSLMEIFNKGTRR